MDSEMWESLSGLERRSVDYNLVLEILFKVSFDHVIVLPLDLVVNQNIDKPLDLMPRNFEFLLKTPDIVFG
jgi:alpha-N-acetylglucosamine transferase